MVAVAGLGADATAAAVRSAAQWATVLGRHPSITDLSCVEPEDPAREEPRSPIGGGRVARARVPCGLERIRREPAEVSVALLGRLRRHERASDLVIVSIPARERLALMRAAFLAGAIVMPVDGSGADLDEALDVTREVLRNFLEVSVWPFATCARNMERFLKAAGEHDRARILPFDPGHRDLGAAFDGLRDAPREGFLVGLLAPEPATLSEELLRIDSVPL
jgi:hypothetical protein